MSGTVVPFRRPARPLPKAPPAGAIAVTLSIQDGAVVLSVDGFEVEFYPAQAAELGRDLIDLAADAEAGRG